MKKNNPFDLKKKIATAVVLCILFLSTVTAIAQCQPSIKIDGNQVMVGQKDADAWVSFPIWLKEGQTVDVDQLVYSISAIEFSIGQNALEFSQVLSINSLQTVPAGKTWKVESVVRERNLNTLSNGVLYNAPGVHTFSVPACVSYLCVEVWGGGGSGAAGGNYNGGGGGAGGYGRECFSVTPNDTYTVTVGIGGKNANGGNSSFGSLISATGGVGVLNSGTTGGVGGTSTAAFNITGGKGANGVSNMGGDGGAAGNGGVGGAGSNPGIMGTAPGGGGGGGGYMNSTVYPGGGGAPGAVKISW